MVQSRVHLQGRQLTDLYVASEERITYKLLEIRSCYTAQPELFSEKHLAGFHVLFVLAVLTPVPRLFSECLKPLSTLQDMH